MLTLYNGTQSTCSQKVRLCLAEKQIVWTDRLIDFSTGEQYSEAYLAINPNGVVPTLVHDDRPVVDSSVILEYLDEVFPDIRLTPQDPVDRAAMRAWLRFFEEVPTVAVRFPSYNQVLMRYYGTLSDDDFAAQADARTIRKHFYRKMGTSGFSEADVAEAMERFRSTAERMERTLGTEPWLMGTEFGLADICVAPLFDRMDDLGHSGLWADCPGVVDWFARLRARPSWAVAFYPGSRFSDTMTETGMPAPN